jgi:hypothetical protein
VEKNVAECFVKKNAALTVSCERTIYRIAENFERQVYYWTERKQEIAIILLKRNWMILALKWKQAPEILMKSGFSQWVSKSSGTVEVWHAVCSLKITGSSLFEEKVTCRFWPHRSPNLKLWIYYF